MKALACDDGGGTQPPPVARSRTGGLHALLPASHRHPILCWCGLARSDLERGFFVALLITPFSSFSVLLAAAVRIVNASSISHLLCVFVLCHILKNLPAGKRKVRLT